ncbi:uracil-DNA glycosylase family protein [Mycolicibacterium sp. CBMA 360]|uniref:uracil-DNA glycosylase n=1 Tax=Mycolicibacterium sp. CBMA 360 TaxID=2606614 RepID=UPI001EF15198|nr:uracil-DNA glycosylase family protein [Mycolicibacterium sp. CBMA 360]
MTNDKSRSALKILLNADIKACRRCEGMNENGVTQSAPGWGNLDSPVAIVGQSLCEQCMAPQEPFYEGSGSLLEAAFKLADCDKQDLFLTNAVHCHPGGNRKSLVVEIANCSSYLYRELEIVRPRLVLALGEDAARALLFLYPTARKVLSRFEPPKNLARRRCRTSISRSIRHGSNVNTTAPSKRST